MGKSDPFVFNFYKKNMPQKNLGKVAFLGYSSHNNFTKSLELDECKFFDLSLDNWEINTFPYDFEDTFDTIVMTRVAYFCSNTHRMIVDISKHLKTKGLLFIDWGFGDHWRFEQFKVGWMRYGENEWAYNEKNHLNSGYFSENMKNSNEYKIFESLCTKFGYEHIEKAIYSECFSVAEDNTFVDNGFKILSEDYLVLWPEKPQMYVCILAEKTSEV